MGKYKKLICFSALVFSSLLYLYSMPPHPDNKNPTGRPRNPFAASAMLGLESSLYRSSSLMHQPPLPADGNMRVLVILADFGADLALSPVIKGPVFNSKSLIPVLLITAAGFLIITRIRKWLIPAGVILITLSSCPSPGGSSWGYGDPLAFKTDPSLYKDILEEGTEGLTMKQYYFDMSKENLTLTFDVVGPFTVSKGWQYYGRNDSNGYDMFPGTFVGEAVDLAKLSGVDFSVYDNNNDDFVDALIVVHAGRGEESGADPDTLWSHYFTLNGAKSWGDGTGARYYDGVTINRYTMQPEYFKISGDSTIGVFCHEFGHVLGLPDLYDTSLETNGVGFWSLMGAGSWGGGDGSRPAPLLAWERYAVGGDAWLTLEAASTEIVNTIENIESSYKAYKIPLNDPGGNQYLLLEGKQQSTGDSWVVPASGILVTHIHDGIISEYSSSNRVNAGFNRIHGVNIVEAANTHDPSGRGLLWTKDNLNQTDYSNMPFKGSEILKPETDSHPNTYYYLDNSESITGKTGNSGVSITFSSASEFTLDIIPD